MEAVFANATCGRSARRGSVITPALIAHTDCLSPAAPGVPSPSGAGVTAPACLHIGAAVDRSSARLSSACGDRSSGFPSRLQTGGRNRSVSLLVSSPKLTRMRCSWSNEPRPGLFVSDGLLKQGANPASVIDRRRAPTRAVKSTTTLQITSPIASMLCLPSRVPFPNIGAEPCETEAFGLREVAQ